MSNFVKLAGSADGVRVKYVHYVNLLHVTSIDHIVYKDNTEILRLDWGTNYVTTGNPKEIKRILSKLGKFK